VNRNTTVATVTGSNVQSHLIDECDHVGSSLIEPEIREGEPEARLLKKIAV
jgi:hypothetical protein